MYIFLSVHNGIKKIFRLILWYLYHELRYSSYSNHFTLLHVGINFITYSNNIIIKYAIFTTKTFHIIQWFIVEFKLNTFISVTYSLMRYTWNLYIYIYIYICYYNIIILYNIDSIASSSFFFSFFLYAVIISLIISIIIIKWKNKLNYKLLFFISYEFYKF